MGDGPTISNGEDEEVKKSEFLFDLAKRRYDEVFQTLKDYDSKAASIVGYVSILTGLLVGLGTFSLLEKLTKPEYYFPYLISIILFLSTVVLSLFAIRMLTYLETPDVELIRERVNDDKYKYKQVMKEILFLMINATSENDKKNNLKAFLIDLSWYCLVAGLISLVIFAYFFITGNLPKFPHISDAKSKAAQLVYSLFSNVNIDTLERLFPGIGEDTPSQDSTLVNREGIYPATESPWMEFDSQWPHDELNVFVIVNSTRLNMPSIVTHVVTNWSDLLKTGSKNSSAWNFHVLNITQGNIRYVEPANIVVILSDESNSKECTDSYGFTEERYANKQYVIVYTLCGNDKTPEEWVKTVLYHEFGHALGLGHAHNEDGDLMCGINERSGNNQTCSILPDASSRPSEFDLDSLFYFYGTDGFGGQNSKLENIRYYLPSQHTLSNNSDITSILTNVSNTNAEDPSLNLSSKQR